MLIFFALGEYYTMWMKQLEQTEAATHNGEGETLIEV